MSAHFMTPVFIEFHSLSAVLRLSKFLLLLVKRNSNMLNNIAITKMDHRCQEPSTEKTYIELWMYRKSGKLIYSREPELNSFVTSAFETIIFGRSVALK